MNTLTINNFVEHLVALTQSKTAQKVVPQISFSYENSKIKNLSVSLFDRKITPEFIQPIVAVSSSNISKSIKQSIISDFSLKTESLHEQDGVWILLQKNNKEYNELILEFLTSPQICIRFFQTEVHDKINFLFKLFVKQNKPCIKEIFDIVFSHKLIPKNSSVSLSLENVKLLPKIKSSSFLLNFFNLSFNNITPQIEDQIITDVENGHYNFMLPFVHKVLSTVISSENRARFENINFFDENKKNHIYETSSLLINTPFHQVTFEKNDLIFSYPFELENDFDTKNLLLILKKKTNFLNSFQRKIPIFLNKQTFNVFVTLDLLNPQPTLIILVHDKSPYDNVSFFKNLDPSITNIDDHFFKNALPELFEFITECKNNILDIFLQKIQYAYQNKLFNDGSKELKPYDVSISEIDYDLNKQNIRKQRLLVELSEIRENQPHSKRKI